VESVRSVISGILDSTIDADTGLDLLAVAPAAEVDPALTSTLHEAGGSLWRAGWQPVELHRVVVRRGHPRDGGIVADVVAAYLRPFPAVRVDERWLAQADELSARVWWTSDATYPTELAARWRSDRVVVLDRILGVLATLVGLPPIEVLVPPPGSAMGPAHPPAHVSPGHSRLLERVRALLAKAEATSYPAEAEAYTAKAQELISRHSLDEALLVARSGDARVVPYARRLGVEPPHDEEKATLLQAVAAANHCRTVWSPEFGFATVFGFDADMDAVEVLYTSLLVQANRAMSQSEPPGGKAGRASLRAFRQSFQIGFAVRIGERLAEAAKTGEAEAIRGNDDLLPVLASRDRQVRETMLRIFPRTVRARGIRVDSDEGWDSGREAADRAALHRGG
jgi:hypothetical protein